MQQFDSSTLRAFGILELVAKSESPPSLDELTHTSGLPKPTVYRILGLLMRGGLVVREPSEKRYVAGPRLHSLAVNVQINSPQRARRRAILTQLVDEIGETCNFTLLDGDEALYLDRVETSRSVRLHMEPGSRVPLHCTASGKLFLAHMPPKQVRKVLGGGPLKRYTDTTTTELASLMNELVKIRADGVSIDVGEYLEGSVCLAVPVPDPHGRVCVAVAVHGPAPRMTVAKGLEYLPALRRAAAALADTLVPEEEIEHTRSPASPRLMRGTG